MGRKNYRCNFIQVPLTPPLAQPSIVDDPPCTSAVVWNSKHARVQPGQRSEDTYLFLTIYFNMAGKCWESKIEDRAKLFESCGLVDALPRNPVCQVLGCLITTVLNVRIDLHNIKIKKHPVLLIMHHVFVQWNCRFLLKFHRCIVNFGLLLVLEPFPFSIPEEKGRNLYYNIILIFLKRDYINLANDRVLDLISHAAN